MNTNLNIAALKRELHSAIRLPLMPSVLRYFGRDDCREALFKRTSMRTLDTNIMRLLRESDVVVNLFEGTMFNTGDGASASSLQELSLWLVGCARVDGVDTATKQLVDFIESDFTNATLIVPIVGIIVETEVVNYQFTAQITLTYEPIYHPS